MAKRDSVADIFNKMQGEYDDIRDLWYAWLFSRLHYFIAQEMAANKTNGAKTVVDVGCGTGLQSFLYAGFGWNVLGIDIAENLILSAKEKTGGTQSRIWSLFPAHFLFVRSYNKKIQGVIKPLNNTAKVPGFIKASANEVPVSGAMADHINCCGSVLSLVDDYTKVLDEIGRILKPGGGFIIEVESRNLDLIWNAADALFLNGKLGYKTTKKRSAGIIREVKE